MYERLRGVFFLNARLSFHFVCLFSRLAPGDYATTQAGVGSDVGKSIGYGKNL
jgi:hypothetical protein